MARAGALNCRRGSGPRNPRHPTRIREGQLFFPLQGKRRQPATVKRVEGEMVRVRYEDGTERTLALDRLLASDGAGNGRFYRFHGWKHRPRGYRTALRVISVSEATHRCVVVLPAWDPSTEIEEALEILPEKLRVAGAEGSCMANLSSSSAAGLTIHSCRGSKVSAGSREAVGVHPETVVAGQRYRRRGGGTFRVLDVSPPRARAWNGRRVVWLSEDRLLATRSDGSGKHYEYLGGGVWAARHKRAGRG